MVSPSPITLPWLSAGPLPPRRKKASRKNQFDGKSQPSGPRSPLEGHNSVVIEAATPPALPVHAPPVVPLPAKVPPKNWADLLRSPISATNGHNGARSHGVVAHSFTNLADLVSRYDPKTHATAAMIQPRGLVNHGNMCFMNAILQVLVYCPPFYNLFDRIGREVRQKISSRTPLMDAMVMFIREFQLLSDIAAHNGLVGEHAKQTALENIGEAFGPDNIYKSMRGNSRFNSMQRGHQEDAEEFLGFLLDGLHEEFLQSMREHASERTIHFDDAPSRAASEIGSNSDDWLEVGKKQKTAHTRSSTVVESPISRIFGGNMRSILRIGGSKDSVTLEPYQPLQLDIQSTGVRSITDALLELPEPEILTDDWNNGSGLKVRATKQVYIESLPPVLILHLKRFLYDNVGGTQKSWKQVGYPLELDIPSQAISPGRRGTFGTKYKLIGVVYHHGLSASGGHYTVDVLRQDCQSWIHLDDTSIESVDAKDVAVEVTAEDNTNHKKPNKLAYILLYARM